MLAWLDTRFVKDSKTVFTLNCFPFLQDVIGKAASNCSTIAQCVTLEEELMKRSQQSTKLYAPVSFSLIW